MNVFKEMWDELLGRKVKDPRNPGSQPEPGSPDSDWVPTPVEHGSTILVNKRTGEIRDPAREAAFAEARMRQSYLRNINLMRGERGLPPLENEQAALDWEKSRMGGGGVQNC